MKRFCRRLIALVNATALILMLLLRIPTSVEASVSGGAGSMSLSPANATIPVNTSQNVNILFNTAGVAISGIQVVLKFTVANPADLTATVQTNSALADSGWTFPVKNVTTSGTQTTIELMGLNTSTTGYTSSGNATLATITFSAVSPFTNKAVTFDAALTKMLKKSDASDMLGTPSNAAYSTSGTANTPTSTPTGTPSHTPTSTSTPTPTAGTGGGTNDNTVPVCASLSSDVATTYGTPATVTFTCSGVDPGGDITAAEFTFGDGTKQVVEKNVGSPGSLIIAHTYNTIGTLGASCRVRDNDNVYSSVSDSCKRVITIRPQTGTPTPTRLATSTVTPTSYLSPTPSGGTVYATATPYETPAPTIVPSPIFGDDGREQTGGNRFWWIIGGALTLIIAFLLLRRRGPPPAPPSPYAPMQPPQPPVQPPPSAQPPVTPPPTG